MTYQASYGGSTPFNDPPTRHRTLPWLDFSLFVAVLLAGTGLLGQFGALDSVVWLAAYGLMMVQFATAFSSVSATLLRHWLLMIYPLYLLLTVVWSIHTTVTLMAGIQMTMTVLIAIYLGNRFSILAIMKMLYTFFAIGIALSCVHWLTSVFPWPRTSADGGLIGVFTSKNTLGQQANMLVLLSLAFWVMPRGTVPKSILSSSILLVPVALIMLWLSQSMTAVILTPVGFGILCLALIQRLPLGIGIAGVIVLILSAAVGPLIFAVMGTTPVDLVFDLSGKSRTLTGRTELWDIARGVSAEYPWLGVGFRAFWTAPLMANEQLQAVLAGSHSPSFHNFIWELRVAGGVPAVVIALATFAIAIGRLARDFFQSGGADRAFALVATLLLISFALMIPALARPHEYMLMIIIMFAVSTVTSRDSRSYS